VENVLSMPRSSAKTGAAVELRQRKSRKSVEQQPIEPSVQSNKNKRTVWQELTTPWLQFRYCVGFLMGLVACIGSIVTYQKDDSSKEYKFTAWLFFALIGLCFHETRPFKRF
jgi:hypothetical protein